jgi:hypothetical protein
MAYFRVCCAGAAEENEQAPFGTGIFEPDRHQRFDQPAENDLTGNSLRGLDH